MVHCLKHLWFCICLISLPTPGLWAADRHAQTRPNVLFIAIDDLRPALGCYGDPIALTPHIDSLAATARQFNRAYCQQAVCGPSRASLLTGRLPASTRVWHNRNHFRKQLPNVVTLPQLFKNNGYHTQSMGKVFSGDRREEDPRSWSVPAVLRRQGWRNYALHESEGERKKGVAFEAAEVGDDGYTDGKLAELAVRTLKQLTSSPNSEPFFLAVGFFKPHLPFAAPRKYWDLYDPNDFDLEMPNDPVKNAPVIAFHAHRELGGYSDVPAHEEVSKQQARRLRHGYYACVSYIDAQVGKLLQSLKQYELDQNTIVVLWGDHGFALGEGQRWCKGTNFELDTRVPLIIRTPNMTRPGVASEALTELVDIYPTLAELAHISPPDDLDGRSLGKILKDPRTPGRNVVLSQFSRPFKPTHPETIGYSIRTLAHRYTRWVKVDTGKPIAEELYDYIDPENANRQPSLVVERRNLIDDTRHAGIRDQLRAQMDKTLASRIAVDSASSTGRAPKAITK